MAPSNNGFFGYQEFFTSYLGIYEAYQFAEANDIARIKSNENILIFSYFSSYGTNNDHRIYYTKS